VKWKYVRGADLIAFLERMAGPVEGEAPVVDKPEGAEQ
jgi:hypothetical protein